MKGLRTLKEINKKLLRWFRGPNRKGDDMVVLIVEMMLK